MKLELRVIDGPDTGRVFRFDQQQVTVGRADDNDVAINDPDRSISKHHATFTVRGGAMMLKDHSKNGTALDGRRLQYEQEVAVTDRSRIRIGLTTIDVRLEVQAQAVGPAPSADRDTAQTVRVSAPKPAQLPRDESAKTEVRNRPKVVEPAAAAPGKRKSPLKTVLPAAAVILVVMLLGKVLCPSGERPDSAWPFPPTSRKCDVGTAFASIRNTGLDAAQAKALDAGKAMYDDRNKSPASRWNARKRWDEVRESLTGGVGDSMDEMLQTLDYEIDSVARFWLSDARNQRKGGKDSLAAGPCMMILELIPEENDARHRLVRDSMQAWNLWRYVRGK